jgi:hypothetical protein
MTNRVLGSRDGGGSGGEGERDCKRDFRVGQHGGVSFYAVIKGPSLIACKTNLAEDASAFYRTEV